MAIEAERFEEAVPGGRNALYARLPVQLLLIAWAYAAGGDWDQGLSRAATLVSWS